MGQGFIVRKGASLKPLPGVIVPIKEFFQAGIGMRRIFYFNNYIYCATTGFDGRKVYKIDPVNMTKIDESAGYGGDILTLTANNDFVFCAGNSPYSVWKIDPTDMSKKAQSSGYGKIVYGLTCNDDFVFSGDCYSDGVGGKIRKFDIPTMSLKAELPYKEGAYACSVNTLLLVNNYLYCGGNLKKVWKIDPTDMSKIDESEDYGGTIRSLIYDGKYIYCAGETTKKVWKIDPTNMSKIDESEAGNTHITSLGYDGKYVYCGFANPDYKIWTIDPTNMSKKGESITLSDIQDFTFDNQYIYALNGSTMLRIIGDVYTK